MKPGCNNETLEMGVSTVLTDETCGLYFEEYEPVTQIYCRNHLRLDLLLFFVGS